MFSPYYASARRRGPADPLDFCAMNCALYGAAGHRWAMTERRRGRVSRDEHALAIGPSGIEWDGTSMVLHLDEVTAPLPSRIRGTVRVHPEAPAERCYTLDAAGAHRWRPIAPRARVEVELSHPGLRWCGNGYLDSNDGDEPLERAFRSWQWSRASTPFGATVLYDVQRRDGTPLSLALEVNRNGEIAAFVPPPEVALPRTPWRIARSTRADPGTAPAVVETLEDGPFYARSTVKTRIRSQAMTAVHESLSLDRFARRWVQALLPFRMPRALR